MLSQGSASARGRSGSSNRGGSSRGNRGNQSENDSWQSQQSGSSRTNRGNQSRDEDWGSRPGDSGRGNRGNQSNEGWRSRDSDAGRDYEGGYYQASGSRAWEGDRQENFGRGERDWDNRDERNRYESQSRAYDDGRDTGVQSRPHGRGYGDERSFGSNRGGYEDYNQNASAGRQDYDWRPSDGRRSASREGGSWDEGRGYGGERGFGSGRGQIERNAGRERYLTESDASFRQREFAPERSRYDDFRSDDRFGGRYAEDEDYRGSSRGENRGGYQNEDEEERYYSGRGQRSSGGGSESRRGYSSRGMEQRRRE